jgi:hypothetical protein
MMIPLAADPLPLTARIANYRYQLSGSGRIRGTVKTDSSKVKKVGILPAAMTAGRAGAGNCVAENKEPGGWPGSVHYCMAD